jgi:hypothetical protein
MRAWTDLSEQGLSTGEKARLHRILYQFGLRNVWQRGHDESLAFVARLQEILAKYPHERSLARS